MSSVTSIEKSEDVLEEEEDDDEIDSEPCFVDDSCVDEEENNRVMTESMFLISKRIKAPENICQFYLFTHPFT